jgi:hypothetical protein
MGRTAIILSLGMLLEKVDTSGFIGKLLQRAKDENANFDFKLELQKQAFVLSERFNLGKIEPVVFESDLLQLLGIKSMKGEEFWSEWDAMLMLGDIAAKVQQIQDIGHRQGALVYLSSDTNPVHLKKIANECVGKGVNLDIPEQPVQLMQPMLPIKLGQFPLYASCRIGKSRQELIKHIVTDIKAKEINKPDEVVLILGNPENVKDKNHQAVAKNECDSITAWCNANNVSVVLHNNVLEETLTRVFSPDNGADNKIKPTLSK